jgi:hypothetical protein
MLVVGAALQFFAVVSFAQSSGMTCQVEFDGIKWSLNDSLDDLKAGPLDGPLTRSCDSASPWPQGTYSVSATNGGLRVARTLGSDDFRSLTIKDQDAGIVFSGFASNANSFWMLVHGADKEGDYVPNTSMHILVKAVDGSILWSRYFKVNGVPYTLGLSGMAQIASVTVKRSANQPNGVEDSYPVVDFFSTGYDSSFGGANGATQTQRFMGAQ